MLLDIDGAHQPLLMPCVNGETKFDIKGLIKKKFFILGGISKTEK
jgi:hypothetical protein